MSKKRFILLCFILLFAVSFVFADFYEYKPNVGPLLYIRPMNGASGIPMNPERIKGGYSPYTKMTEGVDIVDPTEVTAGHYSRDELIAIGGLNNMKSYEAKGSTLSITASCENGFYFVSQSNPSYKRPFELYIVAKYISEEVGLGRKEVQHFFPVGTLSEASFTKTFTYPSNEEYFKYDPVWNRFRKRYEWNSNPDFKNYFNCYTLWFDMVLGLPGDKVENDVLYVGNQKYPLTKANDYSAVLTITLEGTSQGKKFSKTFTIPMSGYYEPAPTGKTGSPKLASTISLNVRPYANAGNLDLTKTDRQDVASLNVQFSSIDDAIINNYKNGDVVNAPYVVFLSSNSNPEADGKLFKLVKEGVGFGAHQTPYNSVGYTATLSRTNKGHTDKKTFDGTTSYKGSGDNGKVMMPYTTITNEGHSNEPLFLADFDGEIYINIDDNSKYTMEAGRYTSEIYVHVCPVK